MKPKTKTMHDPADPLKVAPITVQRQTAAKLRDAILTGIFKPGERLVETDLCQRMGVSRPSVREALRRLEAERLVTVIPNRGPLVSEISWEEARQIYEVRSLLEGEAAARFATRITRQEQRALSEALRDFESAVARDDPLERVAATTRFYEIILGGCGNCVIAEILEGLMARINFLRAKSMSHSGRAKRSATEMRKMFVAIAAGDATAARKAAVRHVEEASRAAHSVYLEPETRSTKTPPASSEVV